MNKLTNSEKLTLLWQTISSLRRSCGEEEFDAKTVDYFYAELQPLSLEFQVKMGATDEFAICAGCSTLGSHGDLVNYKGRACHDNTKCRAVVLEMYTNASPLTVEQIDRMRDILLSERRKKAIAGGMFYAIEYPDGKTEMLRAGRCNDFVTNIASANRDEFEALNGYSRTDAIRALHNAPIVSAESLRLAGD